MAYYVLPGDPKNGYLQSVSGPIPGHITEYTPDAKDKDLAALYRHLCKEAKTVGKQIEMDVAKAV